MGSVRLCCSSAFLLIAFASSLAAQSTQGGLHALPSTFQADSNTRMSGLESWGKLIGSTLLFNQGGNAQSGAYSLQSLVSKTQQQIILQAAGLAKQSKTAAQKNPEAVPLQFSAERANENPLEKWTRVLVGEANTAARKAISKGWSSLSRVGKAAFDSFQGTAPASDVWSAVQKSFQADEAADAEEPQLPPFLSDATLIDIADPAVFAYDLTPVSTDVTGVGVSLNIFSIAPCVVVVDAVGVKVENVLIKVEPTLIHVGPVGVDVGASLIEVTPHLINVGPFGSELSIDLPGAISVEDVGIEVSPIGEENEFGPGADTEAAEGATAEELLT
ncbi:g5994 [Coccomyxa elongata]